MVSDGESTNRSYRIPVGIRESDSAIFMPGTIVNFGLRMLIVRHVCISNDLKHLTLSLKVSCTSISINCIILKHFLKKKYFH